MSFLTQKHLSRRTVLRGMGATIALPLLDSMIPARAVLAKTSAAKAAERVRLVCIEQVHGAAHAGRGAHQAMRFLIVALAAFLLGLGLLSLLIDGFGVGSLAAQAVSIVAATPLSFAANRWWTFPAR